MKIFSQMPTYQTASYHQRNNQYATNYNHSQLKCDTVSFGSMKKKEFQGIDRACVKLHGNNCGSIIAVHTEMS